MTLFQRICRVLLGLLALAILPLCAVAASIHALLGVVAFIGMGAAMWWLYRRIPATSAEVRSAALAGESPFVELTAVGAVDGAASAAGVEELAIAPATTPLEPAGDAIRPDRRLSTDDADTPAGVGTPATRGRALAVERSALLAAAAIAASFVVLAGLRLYRLDQLQGEWYGDISTVYEYVMSVREHSYPRDLYNLGVGPLYPLILWPSLGVLGESYLGFKRAAVLISLAGLAALFLFCRRLGGTWFAVVATTVAGTGSWLLIYSRLGDVQAAVLLFTIGPLALAARIVESAPPRPWSAALCGLMAGACIYLYGAAFMVPVLTTLLLVAGPPRSRAKRRDLVIYLAAIAAVALPMAVSWLRAPDAFAQGHFASRLLRGPGLVSTVASNFATALMAYATRGDASYRGNSPLMPHIDRLSLALAVLGCIYWLRPRAPSRKWGAILVGGFLLMHVPSILVSSLEVPSSGRSIAAAPFAYILAASGLWWIAELVSRHWSTRHGAAVAATLLVALTALNARRYFVRYIATLPYSNTHIARAITRFVDLLPSNTSVYMVGPPWSPGGMPEPKSILYNMRAPQRFHEQPIEDLDCNRLGALELPAVLVWSFASELPSPGLSDCVGDIPSQLYTSDRDLPIFHAATVQLGRPANLSFVPTSTAATEAPVDLPPAVPTPVSAASPPETWGTAQLDFGGLAAEMRFMPTDAGAPANVNDGNTGTVLRGARDNPYLVELRFTAPARIASFSLDLGYMSEFDVMVTVTAADGKETTLTDHQKPAPGTAPRSVLVLPNGPLEVASARISIEDIRETPGEGWHIHIFELAIGREADARAPREPR